MRLRIDERFNVALLALRADGERVQVKTTMPIAPPGATRADERLILEFDGDGRLVGIEFLVAHEQLLPSVLHHAKPYRDAGS